MGAGSRFLNFSELTALSWPYLESIQTTLELCLAPRFLHLASGMTRAAAINRLPPGIAAFTPGTSSVQSSSSH